MSGRPWLLLPDAIRFPELARNYPLPSGREELKKLASIDFPRNKLDVGCSYLRRCRKAWAKDFGPNEPKSRKVDRLEDGMSKREAQFRVEVHRIRTQMRAAVSEVKREAEQAVASLHDLFALGRQGLEGQMKAHLAGTEWQGEGISASAFRDCFRMVTQAVKGLGVPTGQEKDAEDTVYEQVAEGLKATQEVVALAPGTKPEVEH